MPPAHVPLNASGAGRINESSGAAEPIKWDLREFGCARGRAVFSCLLSDQGGRRVWIVRLVQIGADGEAPFVDVMTINRSGTRNVHQQLSEKFAAPALLDENQGKMSRDNRPGNHPP
jgi:hypothetical protein